MDVLSKVSAQSIRLLNVAGIAGGSIYGVKLARMCEERYGFFQSPRNLEEFDLERGITFQHGFFNNVVIDKFQIFSTGVLALSKTDTDFCDAFIDDVVNWVQMAGGVSITSPEIQTRIYASHIEARYSFDADRAFWLLNNIGRQISEAMRSYNQIADDMKFYGFQLSPGIGASASKFKMERSENQTAPPNTYFSSAPMRTKDHIFLLQSIDKYLSGSQAAITETKIL